MRLGIDYRGAQSGGGSGHRGIGRYTFELVRGLLDFAPEIDIILFCRDATEVPAEVANRCTLVTVAAPSWSDAKKPLWLRIPKLRSMKSLHERRFRRAVERQKRAMEDALRRNPVDLVHIPSALDVGSYPIFDASCPVVMTFLDGIVLKLRDITLDRFPWFLQDYYFEQAKNLLRADRIVAISQASAQDAVEMFGIEPSLIDVVYPAVSKDYAVPRERPKLAGSNPYFLFCSVPDPHKNPLVVLEAFKAMPKEYRLIFVSPTDSVFVPPLIEYARQNGFEDRFMVTGYVPEIELHALFQHTAALLSPSKMEGLGLPVAQAMRAGTPVVTSKFSAQGEIAEGVGYLVDPNSVEEVAQAMRQVIADGRQPGRMARGQEQAKLFDPEVVTKQLVETYRKSLAAK